MIRTGGGLPWFVLPGMKRPNMAQVIMMKAGGRLPWFASEGWDDWTDCRGYLKVT